METLIGEKVNYKWSVKLLRKGCQIRGHTQQTKSKLKLTRKNHSLQFNFLDEIQDRTASRSNYEIKRERMAFHECAVSEVFLNRICILAQTIMTGNSKQSNLFSLRKFPAVSGMGSTEATEKCSYVESDAETMNQVPKRKKTKIKITAVIKGSKYLSKSWSVRSCTRTSNFHILDKNPEDSYQNGIHRNPDYSPKYSMKDTSVAWFQATWCCLMNWFQD